MSAGARKGPKITVCDPEPVIRLDLNMEGLDFLCEELPQRDGFTKALQKLRLEIEAAAH